MMDTQTNQRIVWVPLAKLRKWDRNYRVGNIEAITASIVRFGYNGTLRVWKDGMVMAGNHALICLQTMKANGATAPDGVKTKGRDWLIPCVDVSNLSRLEAEAFAIADNRTQELGQNDPERLAELLAGINTEDSSLVGIAGYTETDLKALLRQVATAMNEQSLDEVPEPQIDRASDLRAKWKTESGQLWRIGKHRLICGDSTDANVVRRLMDGERAILFSTDPPYLVDYDGTNHPHKWGEDDEAKNKDWSESYQDWDKAVDGEGLYDGFISVAIAEAIEPNAAWYCWHASRRQGMVEKIWEQHGAFVHQQIIWAKDRPVLTRSWFMWRHEPCFFGWVKGQKPPRQSDDYPHSVWEIPTVAPGSETLHPTSKPLELFAIPIRQHTLPGEICYEPFSGSGSQLLACEVLGRRCFAGERAPEYIAVALERASEMGLEPELIHAEEGAPARI